MTDIFKGVGGLLYNSRAEFLQLLLLFLFLIIYYLKRLALAYLIPARCHKNVILFVKLKTTVKSHTVSCLV